MMEHESGFFVRFRQTRFAAVLDRIRRPRVLVPLYVVCMLVFGSIGILTTPIGSISDTWAHIYRIDAFLNGKLFAEPVGSLSLIYQVPGTSYGGPVDWDLVHLSTTADDLTSVVMVDTITTSTAEQAYVPFNGAAIYSPLSYLPYLLGLSLAKALGASALAQYYVMLFFGLVFFCAISAISLLILPRFRILAALFYVFPLSIMLISSITADGMTLAYIAFFSCLLYRCYVFRPTRPMLALLMFLGFLVAFSKLAYAPLLFAPLALFFIHRRLKGKAIVISGVFASTVLLLLWTSTTGSFATNPNVVSTAEIAARTSAILSNPLPLIQRVLYSIFTLQGYSATFDIRHVLVALFFYLCVLLAFILVTVQLVKKRFDKKQAIFWYACIVLVVLSVFLIFTALYLQYDIRETPGIIGVQPRRYFWPMALLMLFSIGESIYVLNPIKKPLDEAHD